MQNPGKDDSDRSEDGMGSQAIISDLAAAIEQVQAIVKLIESAIAREASPDQDGAANVIVLDDVTPRYLEANAALNACNAGLGRALHFLLDSAASQHGPDGRGERDRPVRQALRAASRRRPAGDLLLT